MILSEEHQSFLGLPFKVRPLSSELQKYYVITRNNMSEKGNNWPWVHSKESDDLVSRKIAIQTL